MYIHTYICMLQIKLHFAINPVPNSNNEQRDFIHENLSTETKETQTIKYIVMSQEGTTTRYPAHKIYSLP